MTDSAAKDATPDRAPWPWRAGALLATLATGALLAWVVASWGWRWLGPSTSPAVADAPIAPTLEALVAAAPFGRAPAASATPGAPPGAAAAASTDIRLLGVFAGRDGDGYALVRVPDRGALLVKRGQDIASGVRLEAVEPSGVRIRDRGAVRDIQLWRETRGGLIAPAAAPRPAANAAVAQRAACARPPGFAGPVYQLNAELLAGMAAQPQSWAALLAPGAGALVVRDDTGLAAMLGMKAGDRIAQANGIALGAIDDVLAAVVKPLSASQPVRVSGTRDGQPREWLFVNASACAG